MTDSVKNKGVVFTPEYITNFMADFIEDDMRLKIFEPCCGKGVFLKTLIERGYKNIHANDIDSVFVDECKTSFNSVSYYNNNFIDFNQEDKYDVIIGNPPYVKIQNLANEDIVKIKNQYDIKGNLDLYLYFIVKCVDMLKDDGKLIFIIPNSFMYNKSCEKIKQRFIDMGYLEYVIDFKHEKIFKGYSVYTCILVINKKDSSSRKSFLYKTCIEGEYKTISYRSQNVENSLLKYINLKNGIATLRDSIFIIKDARIDGDHMYFSKHGTEYKIEKKITRRVLKVSKKEEYYIIYPYDTKCKIYDTLDDYPLCQNYLLSFKESLVMRDKGNKKYEKWFAYGRSQALNTSETERMFIPSLVQNVGDSVFKVNIQLFYSGLHIEVKPEFTGIVTNEDIKRIIVENSSTIEERCNVKSGGWYIINKKSFDIPVNL